MPKPPVQLVTDGAMLGDKQTLPAKGSAGVQGLPAFRAGASNCALVQKRQAQMLVKKQPKLSPAKGQAKGGVRDAGTPGHGVGFPLLDPAWRRRM